MSDVHSAHGMHRNLAPHEGSSVCLDWVEGQMSEGIDHDRRRFLSSAAKTIAAAELAMIGSAEAQSSRGAVAGYARNQARDEHGIGLAEAD